MECDNDIDNIHSNSSLNCHTQSFNRNDSRNLHSYNNKSQAPSEIKNLPISNAKHQIITDNIKMQEIIQTSSVICNSVGFPSGEITANINNTYENSNNTHRISQTPLGEVNKHNSSTTAKHSQNNLEQKIKYQQNLSEERKKIFFKSPEVTKFAAVSPETVNSISGEKNEITDKKKINKTHSQTNENFKLDEPLISTSFAHFKTDSQIQTLPKKSISYANALSINKDVKTAETNSVSNINEMLIGISEYEREITTEDNQHPQSIKILNYNNITDEMHQNINFNFNKTIPNMLYKSFQNYYNDKTLILAVTNENLSLYKFPMEHLYSVIKQHDSELGIYQILTHPNDRYVAIEFKTWADRLQFKNNIKILGNKILCTVEMNRPMILQGKIKNCLTRFTEQELQNILNPYGTVSKFKFLPDPILNGNIISNAAIFSLAMKKNVSPTDIPTVVNARGSPMVLTFRGVRPQCFHCLQRTHFIKDCLARICTTCNQKKGKFHRCNGKNIETTTTTDTKQSPKTDNNIENHTDKHRASTSNYTESIDITPTDVTPDHIISRDEDQDENLSQQTEMEFHNNTTKNRNDKQTTTSSTPHLISNQYTDNIQSINSTTLEKKGYESMLDNPSDLKSLPIEETDTRIKIDKNNTQSPRKSQSKQNTITPHPQKESSKTNKPRKKFNPAHTKTQNLGEKDGLSGHWNQDLSQEVELTRQAIPNINKRKSDVPDKSSSDDDINSGFITQLPTLKPDSQESQSKHKVSWEKKKRKTSEHSDTDSAPMEDDPYLELPDSMENEDLPVLMESNLHQLSLEEASDQETNYSHLLPNSPRDQGPAGGAGTLYYEL